MLLFTLPNLAVSCPIHSITLFYLARTSHRLTLFIFASWKDLKPELLQLTHLFSQGISKAPFQVHYYSGALPTQHGNYRSFTPKRYRQLRVKDLPKAPTWRSELTHTPSTFFRRHFIQYWSPFSPPQYQQITPSDFTRVHALILIYAWNQLCMATPATRFLCVHCSPNCLRLNWFVTTIHFNQSLLLSQLYS